MRGLTVIIPSKTISNLDPCVDAICESEKSGKLRFAIIDDGIDWKASKLAKDWISPEDGDQILPGVKPFSFPANVNIGIRAAGDDDVCIVNDDSLLKTPGGFTAMQAAHYRDPRYGILSATTNVAGNSDQHPVGPPQDSIRDAGWRHIAFVCVFIPRAVIEIIGMFDEQFGGGPDEQGRVRYGSEDSDLCERVLRSGLKIGIYENCYVDHGSLRSTFRGDPLAAGDCRAGREIYARKWGNAQ